MPVLPLVDLLILLGWTSVMAGVAMKAIWMSTVYQPTVLGLTPMDFLEGGAVCLLFAVALAARTWLKLNEPRMRSASLGREPGAARPRPVTARRPRDGDEPEREGRELRA